MTLDGLFVLRLPRSVLNIISDSLATPSTDWYKSLALYVTFLEVYACALTSYLQERNSLGGERSIAAPKRATPYAC